MNDSDRKSPASARPVGRGTQKATRKTAKHRFSPELPANVPMPKKNAIQSLVTTLPVIMLLAGLGFYFLNEQKQFAGEPILAQQVSYSGKYSGISKQSESVNAQRLLWIQTSGQLRGARIDYAQYKKLSGIADNSQMTVWAAPRVEGSKTLWVIKLSSLGKVILGEATQLPPDYTKATDRQ